MDKEHGKIGYDCLLTLVTTNADGVGKVGQITTTVGRHDGTSTKIGRQLRQWKSICLLNVKTSKAEQPC